MPVRGWLLLLCIQLTVWNPASVAIVASSRVAGGHTLAPIALVFLVTRLIVTGIGVAAGMALWHKRIGAVKLAKASLVLTAIEAVVRLSTRVGLSEAPPGTRLPLALAIVLYNGVWYAYFVRSRRVRATFAEQEVRRPWGS